MNTGSSEPVSRLEEQLPLTWSRKWVSVGVEPEGHDLRWAIRVCISLDLHLHVHLVLFRCHLFVERYNYHARALQGQHVLLLSIIITIYYY